ncbi:MAG TPA: TraC family protein [Candidatus Sulfotelmatobacter sp.]|nr:TraC family protein [Candidatus Sulfotelmatobacter sp.]
MFRRSNNRASYNRASSRKQVSIKSVSDSILELDNNEYRAILEVNSINFELKSDIERDATIDIYQSLLNSLPCPVQIVVRVRSIDIDSYVASFSSFAAVENRIYKTQISNYQQFVKKLVRENKILTRRFYLIIPFEAKDKANHTENLNLYCDILTKNFNKLGILTKRLTNLEIVNLFYGFYDAEKSKNQPLSELMFNFSGEVVC